MIFDKNHIRKHVIKQNLKAINKVMKKLRKNPEKYKKKLDDRIGSPLIMEYNIPGFDDLGDHIMLWELTNEYIKQYRLELDLLLGKNYSFWMDQRICFKYIIPCRGKEYGLKKYKD